MSQNGQQQKTNIIIDNVHCKSKLIHNYLTFLLLKKYVSLYITTENVYLKSCKLRNSLYVTENTQFKMYRSLLFHNLSLEWATLMSENLFTYFVTVRRCLSKTFNELAQRTRTHGYIHAFIHKQMQYLAPCGY